MTPLISQNGIKYYAQRHLWSRRTLTEPDIVIASPSADNTITAAGIKAKNTGILTLFNRDSCLCIKLRIPGKSLDTENAPYKSGGVIFSSMKRVADGSRKYDQDSKISVFVPVERLGPLLDISNFSEIGDSGISLDGVEGSEIYIFSSEENPGGAIIRLTQIKQVDVIQPAIRKNKSTGEDVTITKVKKKREPMDLTFYCKHGDIALILSGIRGVIPHLLGWVS